MNKLTIIGNLTRDPESRTTPNGNNVCTFTVAVNRRRSQNSNQPEADFFNVTAWRERAEFVAKYFRKGSAVCVVGSIQNRTWTDQQGVKRYMTDIVADEVNFVESRSSSDSYSGQQEPYAAPTPAYSSPAASAPKFEEIKTDDDLPF